MRTGLSGDINVTIYKVGKNSYEGKKGKMKVKVKDLQE